MRSRLILTLFFLLVGPGLARAQAEPGDEGTDKPVVGPTDPYNVYGTGLFQEVYIDEDFKLYKVRTYQGVVPGRDTENGILPDEREPAAGKVVVDRIGFEQRELFSRVFILADRSISPWVYDNFVQAQADPSIPHQIYVEIARAKIATFNDKRPLVTRSFNTPIMSIEGTETKEGVRVVITLKREARYLPVQVGKVLYVDVER
jgi:hypothetical protein